MEQFAMMLSLLGLLFLAIGSIGLVIDAFREGFFWGLGCLLFAPVVLAFIVFHWQEAKQAFCIWLIGFAMIFLAGSMSSEPQLVEEPAREQELQEVKDEKPSSFKAIGIGIGVFILLGGICVVLVKFLKDRSSSEIYYDEDDQYSSETEEDPFGEIDEPPTAQSLISDLGDEDPLVRGNAAVNLGETGDKQAIKPLAKALKDEDQDVRKAAKQSLIQILIRNLDDKDPRSRATATKALGQIGGKRAIKPLAKALKDEDQTVCITAKESLAQVKKRLGPEEWEKIVHRPGLSAAVGETDY
jgi:HEAT repeat protein